MDVSLQNTCKPHLVSRSKLTIRQLFVARRPLFLNVYLSSSFSLVNSAIHLRIPPKPSVRGTSRAGYNACKLRHIVQTRAVLWCPSYNSNFPLTRVQDKYGGISSSRVRGRRKVGIAHFEEGHRSSSGDGEIDSGVSERPPFDLDLAVILAGFAFEAYNTPAENVGVHETDAGDCKTTYLTSDFLREVYDGQIFVKLKKGMHFPGLDIWGTSDPYVVLRCGDCEARSRVVWATRDPVWNEDLTLNIKDPASQSLQIAAWDANIITAHRRMGNTSLTLETLSDGKKHDVDLQLEGMGGGGAVQLEVQYRSFADLDSEKSWWRLPSFTDIFQINSVEDAYNRVFGEKGIKAGEFVRSTLGSLSFLVETGEAVDRSSGDVSNISSRQEELLEQEEETAEVQFLQTKENVSRNGNAENVPVKTKENKSGRSGTGEERESAEQSRGWFDFPNIMQETARSSLEESGDDGGDYVRDVMQAIGETLTSLGVYIDGLDYFDKDTLQAEREATKQLGLEYQSKAELNYVASGLALPQRQENTISANKDVQQDLVLSPEQLKKFSRSIWRNTENFLGLWAMVASSFSGIQKEEDENGCADVSEFNDQHRRREQFSEKETGQANTLEDDGKENDTTRQMFQTAESAVEAWAMLATSLGGKSFVKSEFEKICFLENERTDTEVAIWRDVQRRRLVVAFRGTEQTKWKDLSTDINVFPVGFNPERIGGDFKEEVMVHGGFLNAYDSVRRRLTTLVHASLGIRDIDGHAFQSWQVYVSGHSLGGALATLFALELSSSKLAKAGHVQVAMYNFGSPRVGNKLFADMYNQKVKSSWRVVNHRDIIPTVPRLMGYCHVAQPIYLSAGALTDAIVERDLLEDGYHGDVIGEVTPDFVLENMMKGERKMLERLLQTEIAMLRSIRDGSALMQHMEDFYYIALLERVEHSMKQRS